MARQSDLLVWISTSRIEKLDQNYVVKVSPITYITADMPPVLLQHGNRDALVL